LRPLAERAITLAKRGVQADSPAKTLSYRRLAAKYFIGGQSELRLRFPGAKEKSTFPRTGGVHALKKLFDDIGPRYLERPGGYTRIIKLGWRRGDGAEMARIELVEGQSSQSTKAAK
jgi:large subunit ribosomal protein L17